MNKNCSKKLLYLPVEIISRELDAKLLFTLAVLQEDFSVVIGDQNEILKIAQYGPSGIFFWKNLRFKNKWITDLITRRHEVVVLHEEGLVYLDIGAYAESIDRGLLEDLRYFLTWGVTQATSLKAHYPEFADKFVVTGNPRFDLFHDPMADIYRRLSLKYKEKYGKYILINSRFAMVNHPISSDYWISSVIKVHGKSKQFLSEYVEYCTIIVSEFNLLIVRLAEEFPDHTVVVRPHPAEAVDAWVFDNHKNVVVTGEGNVLEWISGAELIIHEGCTTGIESSAMGVKTIVFKPVSDERFDIDLPNSIGIQAVSINEVIDITRGRFESKKYKYFEDAAIQHIANWSEPSSVDSILNVLKKIDCPKHSSRLLVLCARLLGVIPDTITRLRALRNVLIGRKNIEKFNQIHMKNFGSLSTDNLVSRLETVSSCKLSNSEASHTLPVCRQISSKVWLIQSTE